MLRSMRAPSDSAFLCATASARMSLACSTRRSCSERASSRLARAWATRAALTQGEQTVAAGGEEFFAGLAHLAPGGRGVGGRLGLGGEFGLERGDLLLGGGGGGGELFAALGFEVGVERLLDGEQAQVGPEQLVELAQAGVEREGEIAGAGQYVHLEQPDAVIEHLRAFLEEVDR